MIKSSPLLSNLQSKVWEQQIAQQPDDALHSYLDNMIVPTLLDAYVSPFRKLTGREVVDFRNNYRAKQPRNREKETVSYDTRPHDTHDRRILLAAECQIGKTGVYLALLQDLKQTLSSEAEVTVDIALPDLHTMPPPSTADVCDMPEDDDTVTVDYSK